MLWRFKKPVRCPGPSVSEAVRLLEERDLVRRARRRTDPERVIERVQTIIGQPVPEDLKQLYREYVEWVGPFQAQAPEWNEYLGRWLDDSVDRLLPIQAIPIFDDGSLNAYGVDLSSGSDTPAVYFFSLEESVGFEDDLDVLQPPVWAAGSTIARFLLILAGDDGNGSAGNSREWHLAIDPDLERCPRARAPWNSR